MHTRSIPALGHSPLTVGSVGDANTLAALHAQDLASQCDIMEIRLDGLAAAGSMPNRESWQPFRSIPLLFTARCPKEGGSIPWDTATRIAVLTEALPDAALIDIEAANIDSMRPLIDAASYLDIPWIASFHDFEKLPTEDCLLMHLDKARTAGAFAFKWAAYLGGRDEMAWMIDFQRHNHGLPVASMGMGPLGAESRVLAAQAGSVLNYGYLGSQPTAPGQWHASRLKHAITAGLNP